MREPYANDYAILLMGSPGGLPPANAVGIKNRLSHDVQATVQEYFGNFVVERISIRS